MMWLAPWYLLGIVAVGWPIWLHLWQRSPRKLVPFSTTMFFDSVPQFRSAPQRITHWPLLVLRALMVLLLIAAFARPFLPSALLGGTGQSGADLRVLLVDVSASMRRSGLTESAQTQARQWLDSAPRDAHLALYAFDQSVRGLVPIDLTPPDEAAAGSTGTVDASTAIGVSQADRRTLVRQQLDQLVAGWGSTRLGSVLRQVQDTAAQWIAGQAKGSHATVTVLSDFGSGSSLEGLRELDPEAAITWTALRAEATSAGNAGLALVQGEAAQRESAKPSVRLRVATTSRSEPDQYTLHADGATGAVLQTLVVPAGTSRTLQLPRRPEPSATTSPPAIDDLNAIVLVGDDEPFDDTVYLPTNLQPRLRSVYAGREDPNDIEQPRFYWNGVAQAASRFEVTETALDAAVGDATFVPHLVVWTAADAVPQEVLTRWLAGGAMVLAVPQDAPGGNAMLTALGTSVTCEEMRPAKYALFGRADFTHPWLAPFAEANFADFSGIHVWQYRRLTQGIPGTTTLISFDDGSPALLWADGTAGSGRWAMLLTGWHPNDSQLARSSKFAPLLLRLMELATGERTGRSALTVGDSWPTTTVDGEPVTALEPLLLADAQTAAGPLRLADQPAATTPGLYHVVGSQREEIWAVNLSASESLTDPLTAEQLEQAGWPGAPPAGSVARAVSAGAPQIVALESTQALRAEEQQQQWWRWALLAVVGLLIVEAIVAWWLRQGTAAVTV